MSRLEVDTSTASGNAEGHFPDLRRTRYDEPYLRVERELLHTVLADENVQEAHLAVGPEPPLASRWKRRENNVEWHVTRTRRAQRSYLVHLALRGVLTCGEIDHYASVIAARRRLGIWPLAEPPLSHPTGVETMGRDGAGKRKRRGPDTQTVVLAAQALGECVKSARAGLPERLDKREQAALYHVLAFLDLELAPRPSRSAVAADKRRQREAPARAEAVDAERRALEAEVEAGRMIRVEDRLYANAPGTN